MISGKKPKMSMKVRNWMRNCIITDKDEDRKLEMHKKWNFEAKRMFWIKNTILIRKFSPIFFH